MQRVPSHLRGLRAGVALVVLAVGLTAVIVGFGRTPSAPEGAVHVAPTPSAPVVPSPSPEPPTPSPSPEPEPPGLTPEPLAALPRPVANLLLPPGLPQAAPEQVTGFVAIPLADLTPAYAAAADTEPVLALEAETNTVVEPIPARWTVVGQQHDRVQVLVPTGRGALPSVDPTLVNHQAVWVPAAAVTLEAEPTLIEVSISYRLLLLWHNEELVTQFHVGVGVIGRTDTPLGLCSMIGHIRTLADVPGLLLSCQSESMDGFAGEDWAPTAIHVGSGFDPNTGGAVSNGCVRVPANLYQEYLTEIRIGTPVLIRP